MDTLFLFPFFIFLLILLILGVSMYFIIVHKNEFEERLALYRPQHQLSQKREAYLKGVRKFRLWVTGIIIVIFIAPLFLYLVLMIQEGVEVLHLLFLDEIIGETLLSLLIPFLVYYLLSYVFKRNEKALRMLVEQMSDSDFDLLLKVKDSLFVLTRYNPPFVLCNKQLYFFIFYTIREIDPAKITDIDWGYGKNGLYVKIKSPKVTRITMSREALSHLLQIIKKYNSKIRTF
ncbi:hypothetical protein HMPREF1320_2232 [Capnocytophaga sp. oral taxon 335 str. F0486]|jgi:hypothetical protein|uniref:hypothetical protein n=1 Tax=Capnocytophaga sp. oral taxon 335 TaxID=712215 RepID=UPI00026F36A6|nr:hypothetical protein [Capnocytophaga sp. oral taxon 335]EJF35721.1 hypothetical protein HMPREF1320_2232 [Capnocytophaga sp. oral taxon 335 str. F0486]